MAWIAVDDDGSESIYANKPYRRTDPNYGSYWKVNGLIGFVNIPKRLHQETSRKRVILGR